MKRSRPRALFLPVILLLILSACPKVPRESVLLSEELGGMIGSARAAHLQLVSEYVAERRGRVEDYMMRVWTPRFLGDFVPGSAILDSLERAPTVARKGELMLLFAEAGLKQISQVRDAKMQALDDVERLLKREIDAHYQDMRTVNQALTAHLKSAADVNELREDLTGRLGLRVRQILPIDKINELLDSLVNKGGEVQEVIDAAKSFPDRVRALLGEKGE